MWLLGVRHPDFFHPEASPSLGVALPHLVHHARHHHHVPSLVSRRGRKGGKEGAPIPLPFCVPAWSFHRPFSFTSHQLNLALDRA